MEIDNASVRFVVAVGQILYGAMQTVFGMLVIIVSAFDEQISITIVGYMKMIIRKRQL